jgi:hypothetical protein
VYLSDRLLALALGQRLQLPHDHLPEFIRAVFWCDECLLKQHSASLKKDWLCTRWTGLSRSASIPLRIISPHPV